ncbi:MAG: zinc ribbon domain-containing protein [Methylococcales bacterium]|nr:zinc ribbon domain-containing protein [Methylococcales bacterium]MBT7408424.1 zinc ribbon domain-containing protein [Methylococcales bacterium]
MLILFGEQIIKKNLKQVEVYCPVCQKKTKYTLSRTREFFTLFFVPVIPMQEIEYLAECEQCKSSMPPDFISNGCQTIFRAPYIESIVIVAAQILIDLGYYQNNIDIIHQVFEEMTGQSLDDDVLSAAIEELKNGSTGVLGSIKLKLKTINESGSLLIIQTTFKFYLGLGALNERERQIIYSIGLIFGYGYSTTEAIIDEMN